MYYTGRRVRALSAVGPSAVQSMSLGVGGPPDLARIPPGDFLMGAFNGEEDERPVHRVHVSEFSIGRFQVTNDEYARFIRATGHPPPGIGILPLVAGQGREADFRDLAGPYVWVNSEPPPGRGAHPVVLIGFDDATAYCRWLSLTADRLFRIPTEAEWEKAARGGVEGRLYPWGDEVDHSSCNFLSEPSMKNQRGTRPTGTYPPNGYGLCDVAGNVWEWVSDWYGSDYYEVSAVRDPRGPGTGTMRVVRGGSWVNEDVRSLRCACRHSVPPDTYAYSIGFRVACTA